ncbi:unnamed protein product [Closterium sp. NIES-53]
MASLNVLTFDAEGRAVDFEVWLDDLQLFLQCDSKDGLSLFDLTSGASTAPTADADSTARSQWSSDRRRRHVEPIRPIRPAASSRPATPSRRAARMCNSKDGLSLFDLTPGASTAPTADADSTVRSQWLTRDAAARLASSPTTAALSRLMLPYPFPDLAAFATVADLVAHLRTSDARYRAALPTEFLPTNFPPHVHHPLLPSHPPP